MLSQSFVAIGTNYTRNCCHRRMKIGLMRVGLGHAPFTGKQRGHREQNASSCAHLSRDVHGLPFDMSGKHRLVGGSPLD